MRIENELKNLILSRYKSLRQFSLDIDMPYSTIDTMLKKGIGGASIQNIIKICQALAIDTDALAEGRLEERKANDIVVTFREQTMLKKYRSIDQEGRQTVDTVLNDIYERCNIIKEDEIVYGSLNKWIDKLPSLASAGIGDYLADGYETEKIAVPNDSKANYAIGVNGDSMLPTYKDGDVVLVQRTNDLDYGDIGIFIIDGNCFIKEYQQDKLVSHNKTYHDILFNENQDIRCVGKVIGIYE